MRSFRPADTRSLVNLLRNGGLDFLEPGGSWVIPHFWDLTNLVTRSESMGSKNNYEIVLGDSPAPGGLVDYWRVLLLETREAQLSQSLLSSALLDFPIPLAADSSRQEVPAGFLSRHERLIYRTRPLSLGLSLRVVRGTVDVAIRVADENGTLAADAVLAARADSFSTGRRWRRLAVSFTPTASPARVLIALSRSAGSDPVEVCFGNIQMVLGAYRDVPYTGDPALSGVPKDAVIMVMGATCPPGYVALEEPEGQTPLPEWLEVDPQASVRRGNFPYHSSDQAALVGAPTHSLDDVDFSPVNNHVIALESFSSRLGSSTTGSVSYNPTVQCPADEPQEDGTANHQHNLSAGGSVPVNRQFLFCRRL